MNNFKLQGWLEAYFEGKLSASEAEELDKAILSDPDLKVKFLARCREEFLLHQIFSEKEEAARHIIPIRRKRKSKVAQRMAASILILLSALFATYLMKKTQPIAKVTEVYELQANSLYAENNGETRVLAVNSTLLSDDKITLPKNARFSLRYSDGTEITFKPDSSIKFLKSNKGKQLKILKGGIHANVTKQPEGKPMKVFVDDLSVTVLGTSFDLARKANTRLTVFSGRVLVNSFEKNEKVFVDAGHYVDEIQGRLNKPKRFETVNHLTLAPVNTSSNQQRWYQLVVDAKHNHRGFVCFEMPDVPKNAIEAELHLRVRGTGIPANENVQIDIYAVNPKERTKVLKGKLEKQRLISTYKGPVAKGMDLVFELDPARIEGSKMNTFMITTDHKKGIWFSNHKSKKPPHLKVMTVTD